MASYSAVFALGLLLRESARRAAGNPRCAYRATRTSVSKSTSVMSRASVSVFRNLMAAVRVNSMSLAHALADVEQQAQMQLGGRRPAPVAGENSVSVCFSPVFDGPRNRRPSDP